MKRIKKRLNVNDFLKWKPPKIVIIFLLFIPIVYSFICNFKLDNDFWFLFNTGKYIVNNGIPYIEPFTIHSNFTFIAQQWLTDIIFYFIYSKFNVYGMYILLLVVNILIIYLVYKISVLVSNKVKLAVFITIIVDLFICVNFLTTRPQIFDIIFLLLEIYLLELYLKKDNKKYLIGLPLISLLMINLHGSTWLILFVFLIPYYIEKIFNKKIKIKPLIITTIIMFLIGFLNPYGIDMMTYLFKSYGVNYINLTINEMKPLSIDKNIYIYIYMLIIIISYIINKNKKINIRYTLLTLGTIYLTFSHLKGMIYLIITSILILNYNLDLFKEEKKINKPSKLLTIVIILVIGIITIYSFIDKTYLKEKDNYLYDVVTLLNSKDLKDAKIYTDYNEGGYLEYFGYKCYMDARAEVFLKANNKQEDIFTEYYNLYSGFLNYQDFLDKYNFDYLIIASYNHIFFNYLNSSDYKLIYETKKIKVYERVVVNEKI